MSLRSLILGWLLERPCHGYELQQRLLPFEAGSPGLNQGRLYKLLGELEGEGLIRHEVVPQDRLPSRKILYLTPKGKAAFLEWLRSPASLHDATKYEFFLRDPFLVRFLFAHRLGPAGAQELLRRHLRDIEARIREFTRLQRGADAFPEAPGRLAILGLGLRYLVAKLRWLRKRLAELETAPPKGNGARRTVGQTPRPRVARPEVRATRRRRPARG